MTRMSQSHKEELTYTAGEVARAVGIPLATLRTRVERGYLPSLQTQAGNWRRFGNSDVAYAAAFNLVANSLGASSALTIMEDATTSGSGPSLWRQGVNVAFQGASGMCIIVKQCSYKGVPTFEAELIPTEDMVQTAAFGDPTRTGALVGAEEESAELELEPDVVTVFRVGYAIRRAAVALAR